MDRPIVGMIVYGTLKFQSQSRYRGWSPTTCRGTVTRVEETGFWVKYDAIRTELPYDFTSWNKSVFPDKDACEYETDKANNPGFKEGFEKPGSSRKT